MVVDDPDGRFGVTAFDANHCPGAVMFLFEGDFGNILHTGDCRLIPECLQNLPQKYVTKKGKEPKCQFDYVFLDCTFGRSSLHIPSKHLAIQQVINCIWKHPDAPIVYLCSDMLGQEEILINVSRIFASKIFVDKANNPECFQALTHMVPEILSQDPSSRFQVFEGFPKLCERAQAKLAEAQANSLPEPLIIRPSAQWYACEEDLPKTERRKKESFNEAVRDQFGIWHVCYSIHSSRQELEWALQLLAPKRVVSTTPSCRAMELNYVKKHCFSSHITSSDPLWKLLDIGVEAYSNLDASVKVVGCSPMMEGSSKTCAESQLQLVKISAATQKEQLDLSTPSERPPLTLFGKARFGFQDSTFQHEQEKTMVMKSDPQQIVTNRAENESSSQDVELECENSLEKKIEVDVTEVPSEKLVEKETEVCKIASQAPIILSRGFNESLRNLYRSMNVSVPQPLPSLVELMNSNKRAKKMRWR